MRLPDPDDVMALVVEPAIADVAVGPAIADVAVGPAIILCDPAPRPLSVTACTTTDERAQQQQHALGPDTGVEAAIRAGVGPQIAGQLRDVSVHLAREWTRGAPIHGGCQMRIRHLRAPRIVRVIGRSVAESHVTPEFVFAAPIARGDMPRQCGSGGGEFPTGRGRAGRSHPAAHSTTVPATTTLAPGILSAPSAKSSPGRPHDQHSRAPSHSHSDHPGSSNRPPAASVVRFAVILDASDPTPDDHDQKDQGAAAAATLAQRADVGVARADLAWAAAAERWARLAAEDLAQRGIRLALCRGPTAPWPAFAAACAAQVPPITVVGPVLRADVTAILAVLHPTILSASVVSIAQSDGDAGAADPHRASAPPAGHPPRAAIASFRAVRTVGAVEHVILNLTPGAPATLQRTMVICAPHTAAAAQVDGAVRAALRCVAAAAAAAAEDAGAGRREGRGVAAIAGENAVRAASCVGNAGLVVPGAGGWQLAVAAATERLAARGPQAWGAPSARGLESSGNERGRVVMLAALAEAMRAVPTVLAHAAGGPRLVRQMLAAEGSGPRQCGIVTPLLLSTGESGRAAPSRPETDRAPFFFCAEASPMAHLGASLCPAIEAGVAEPIAVALGITRCILETAHQLLRVAPGTRCVFFFFFLRERERDIEFSHTRDNSQLTPSFTH
jgi:hypothetical protein